MQLSAGDKLGPYEITALIGRGGMGEVYRGVDTRLGRSVAIKVSAREYSDRFAREARAISSLNHPHICTLYDVGPNYLVMEFVEGDTLSKIIAQGPMPLDKALTFAVQIVDALAAAHAKGVIHRDLKPGNIILTRNGVKVLDFGLAKLNAAKTAGGSRASEVTTMTEPITGAGKIVGTLYYMPPEQVEAKEADERSDIFSFGAVVYEMITGKRAFEGDSQASVLAAILRDQPPPMSERQPAVPRTFERVIRKCLEKKPDERWQSAGDLKQTLELIDLDASSTTTTASGPSIPVRAGRRWLWPALALAVILIAAGAAYKFWPQSQFGGRVTRFEVNLPDGVLINPNEFYVRVSPDGSKLAFTTAGDNGGIWVRDLESIEARLLPGTQGALSPYWSPDNKSLAFGSGYKLMRVDIGGGPPQVLCESMYPPTSGFWTGEGEIVFGHRGLGPLEKVKAAGGVPQPVTMLAPGEIFHAFPSLLPDGEHFLYMLGLPTQGGLYVGSLDNKPDQQPRVQVAPAQFGAAFVRANNAAGGDLFFVRDGTLMAQPFDPNTQQLSGDPVPVVQQIGTGANHAHFSVTAGGVLAYRTGPGNKSQIMWLDANGVSQGTVGETMQFSALSLSPDEKQVAVVHGENFVETATSSGDIWLLDVAQNIETRLTAGDPVHVGAFGPVWSPDGKQVAYTVGNRIYTKDTGGATEAKMIEDLGHKAYVTDWTPDGKFLILQDQGLKSFHIRALSIQGGDTLPVVVTGVEEGISRLSPDGHWIAYTSDQAGDVEVYVRPFSEPGSGPASAGPVIQISRGGGGTPQWGPDGKELYFVNASRMLQVAKIDESAGAFRPEAPMPTGIQIGSRNPGWAISKNGKRFLAIQPLDRGNRTPITVVTNWEASLNRQ